MAIAALLYAAVTEIYRQSSYLVRQFDLSPRVLRMTEPERMERAKMGLAGAARAYDGAYAADPRGRAFGFSQAEMSYYSKAPFISYFDVDALPFLKIGDKQELWAALRAKNVRYVLRPAYPLAELNNSAFDSLLADPQLTDIVYDRHGTRLQRVLDAPEPIQPTLLYAEGTEARPIRAQRWKVLTPTPPDNSGKSRMTRSAEGLVFVVPRHPLADRTRWDYVMRGWPINDAPPVFTAPPGRLLLTMEITGRGRFDFLAVTLTKDRATTADTLVWAGVLTGERRIISGQALTPENAAADPDGRLPMGITLRAYRASNDFTIHNWKAEWLPFDSPSPDTSAPQKAIP